MPEQPPPLPPPQPLPRPDEGRVLAVAVRVRNAILGFMLTVTGIAIVLFILFAERSDPWPAVGGIGALLGGLGLLWTAFRS